jgi:hypothetical protein
MIARVGDNDVAVNWTKDGVRKDGLQDGVQKSRLHTSECSKGHHGVWIEGKIRQKVAAVINLPD